MIQTDDSDDDHDGDDDNSGSNGVADFSAV